MGHMDVSATAAFIAGFISFLSPCILPLIPVYIMYITGTTMEDELKDNKALVMSRTLGFVLGFTIIFMIMGTSASFVGKIFLKNKLLFSRISGVIIIIFGLKMMDIIKLDFLSRERKLKANVKVTNWFSSVLMGMAFAAGWTPCFGPTLGGILAFAGSTQTVSTGVYLLFIYSLGMAVPFVLTAIFIDVFNNFINKYERYINYIPKIGGFMMVIFGLLVFFDKMMSISKLFL